MEIELVPRSGVSEAVARAAFLALAAEGLAAAPAPASIAAPWCRAGLEEAVERGALLLGAAPGGSRQAPSARDAATVCGFDPARYVLPARSSRGATRA